MTINTNYSLSRPTHQQIVATFGSSRRALNITGGDIPALCFLIHNPDRVPDSEAQPVDDGMAAQLREWEKDERDAAIIAAWKAQPEDKRKTIAEVMRTTSVGREVVVRVLKEHGFRG